MDYPDMRRIARAVTAARRARGLNVRELALLCGTSYQSIYGVESARYREVRTPLLSSLCRVLGLSADALLGLREEDTDGPCDPDPLATTP